jgi:tetratricopeptide (TPR) repeat protein
MQSARARFQWLKCAAMFLQSSYESLTITSTENTQPAERPVGSARAHLDHGLRLERTGITARALEAFREGLAAATTPGDQALAKLYIARALRTLADWPASRDEAREAVRLALEIGDRDLAAEAMNIEVGALQVQGFFEEADALAGRAIEYATSPRVRGITLQNLGRGAAERGDFETSDRYFSESITSFRQAGYEIGLAIALTNAAKAALDRNDPARSIEIGKEAIALARRLGVLDVLLTTVQNQAAAYVAVGNLESAEGLLTEALGHFTSAGNLVRQAECLEIMGDISERRPDRDTAARCYRRARDLAQTAGDRPLAERLTRRLVELDGATREKKSGV